MRTLCLLLLTMTLGTAQTQKLRISENQRYLVTEDGLPFFYLADTAWELFHRTNRKEAKKYLTKRAEQGFNVIQAVALAEMDGLNTPNAYGDKPLINNDPTTPNPKYFEHVDHIIRSADSLGLYIALLPTWGDKVFKDQWGMGPEVFNTENARVFGQWLGARYQDYKNIIWVLGGDRQPRAGSKDVTIWNQMAEGIADAAGGYASTLMSYHPQPKENGGSSTWFHAQPWLDFNMHQTGHCPNQPTYEHIRYDYALQPIKPVLDGEPLYEDHPNCFRPEELGYSVPEDIRRIMYWNVFAGACGQTYGCHDVWQMYTLDREPVNHPLRPWPLAVDLPMANQVRHLKNLFLSRPYLTRIPDQAMVIDGQKDDTNYVIATRDSEGTYAMVYFPTGKSVRLDLSALSGTELTSWWYDPRTGVAFPAPTVAKVAQVTVVPPTTGKGQDWVYVVEDTSMRFLAPGMVMD